MLSLLKVKRFIAQHMGFDKVMVETDCEVLFNGISTDPRAFCGVLVLWYMIFLHFK